MSEERWGVGGAASFAGAAASGGAARPPIAFLKGPPRAPPRLGY